MRHKRHKDKKKVKEEKIYEAGTFGYFRRMKTMNPRDIYRERLDYLKRKREAKKDGRVAEGCGEKD